ncbi:alpha-1,2-fucosyltransferase [Alphaproteobacteria bacterium]|nr:alpha-1,2-fucosyltransferase [Alphaproteobacteria bacterium]
MVKTVFILVQGGIGNQLFQVAHGISFSEQHNRKAIFIKCPEWFGNTGREWGLGQIGINEARIPVFIKMLLKGGVELLSALTKRFNIKVWGYYDEDYSHIEQLGRQALFIGGYWQSEKYFSQNVKVVRDKFSLPVADSVYRDQISRSSSVAIQIRRGDYISNARAKELHLVCDLNWYYRAVEKMRVYLESPKFYIFTDDEQWAASHFPQNEDFIIIKKSEDDLMDMGLMSLCSNFIISNSSFAWWGSFLGEKSDSITIAPSYWYQGKKTNELGIYRSNWILLS